jgi:hypothetical protein
MSDPAGQRPADNESQRFDIASSQVSLGVQKGAQSRAPAERAGVHRMGLCSIRQKTAETQSARSASRRAQFQLWIFSYTIFVGPSKKCVSRVMMLFRNDFALTLPKGALAD